MRIAHVTDCYLPRVGGIEWQVHDLASHQQAAGHTVEVITSVAAAGDPGPVPVHRPGRPFGGEAIHYVASWRGRARVLTGGYDVVHVHASTFSPLGYLTARTACREGIPTVVTAHSLWAYATPAFQLADRALGWSHWPLTWSAVSTAAAEPLRRLLPPGRSVTLLPNGVDPADWAVDPLPRPPDEVLVAGVMRLAPRKRPLHLLRMLRQAREQAGSEVRLHAVIAGDGPERRSLERYLRRHRMSDWVSLPGRLTRRQIRDIYRRADLFVAPADLESFGIAALEARCAGLPVVAKRATGVRDFVRHEREGLLTDSDEDMVRAIARLATDPETREAMARHNRARPPETSWEDALRRCDALYARAGALVPAQPLTAAAVRSRIVA